MTDAKLRELIQMLTIRTVDSRLRWRKSGIESTYEIDFNRGRITVDYWVNRGKKYSNICIYNKDGYKIEDFKFDDQTDPQWFDLLFKLHAVVETKYLESDFTVDIILDELK